MVTPNALARPAMTLAEALGEDVVYLSRRSPNLHGWSPTAPGQVDMQTGSQLAVAGPLSCVVHAGVVTDAARARLAAAGFSVEADLRVYRSDAEYLALVGDLVRSGRRLSVQRAHPEDEVPPHAATVAPALLRALNDKGRMADIVPEAWLIPRRVVDATELSRPAAWLAEGRPVVLKVATELLSGGGHGVWICRDEADVERARMALGHERRVVVERHLAFARTVCVHGVVRPGGEVVMLGVAEEVVDGAGRWLGNWFDRASDAVPDEAVTRARAIAATAAARGYRGIFGIDVGLAPDGWPWVLDLNFRVNGSTAPAWLRPALVERVGSGASLLLRGYRCQGDFGKLLGVVDAALARGTLLPLCLYDPAQGAVGGDPRLVALVAGPSRAAARAESARIEREMGPRPVVS